MNRLITILLLLISFISFSQDFEKSPKKITFEMGYSHIIHSSFNYSKSAFAFAFDYGWKVSGFNKKPGAYISIPLGYISVPPITEGTKNGGISYYGIHITHELKKDKKMIPFFGYSLLFNQLRVQDTPGRVIGHETRFDAGSSFGKRLYAKAEYSIASYPTLGRKGSDRLGSFGIKIGVRIK